MARMPWASIGNSIGCLSRCWRRPMTSTAEAPSCPRCGKPMVMRTARRGPRAGEQLWGCTDFPNCRGIIDIP